MNWKLIFTLSLFGLAMAIGTVYVLPSKIEPVLWLVIFLLCAYLIARYAPKAYFGHGFLLGLANCVWITGAHVLLSNTYLANHPDEAAQYSSMTAKMGNITAQQAMLLIGPMVGVISGVVIGLLSAIAARIFKK